MSDDLKIDEPVLVRYRAKASAGVGELRETYPEAEADIPALLFQSGVRGSASIDKIYTTQIAIDQWAKEAAESDVRFR